MTDESRTLQTVTESIRIAAQPEQVWDAITDPRAGEIWRNAHFNTDWQIGAPIEIEAEIGAKRYRDKGRVLHVEPPALLAYSYWSQVSGLPDIPQSYATVTMTLAASGGETMLTVTQQVPPSPIRRGNGWEIGADSGAKHVAFYWRMALPRLKQAVEQGRAAQ
ncbi:SRPBCC domain-containing protein [Bradyrhizobium sp. 41S5]|uniref:SRPBCC domain-containing protein n=1 Tax=Bradyrhizobium sp. 41S5 TaxID=1404443 RepID=UPI00156B0572|nr:SRPBCC domain-containing protein [Bradyrhizobium sp. 41S5]UFX45605.1 SRPBCC domain-containing protein [Bradyrhizobium sp. 41S5]